MTAIPIVFSASKRTVGRFPELVQVNMIAETPTGAAQASLIARPGLADFLEVTGSMVRGQWQADGVLDGDMLVVCGTFLYRVTAAGFVTVVGFVSGSDVVQFANDDQVVRICNGNGLYVTEGAAVTFDRANVSSIVYLKGTWYASEVDTGLVYYRLITDTDWDPLNLFTAEQLPDKIVGLDTLGDQLWLFGSKGIEVWAITGEADPPAAPYGGLAWNIGCANRATIVEVDGSLCFVGADNQVLAASGRPQPISDNAMAERVRKADTATMRAWTYSMDGHVHYVLTLGEQGTWTRDMSTGAWSRFKSLGHDEWRAHLGVQTPFGIIAGDLTSGKLWRLDADANDDAGTEMERIATGVAAIDGAPIACDRVSLVCAAGEGRAAGQGSAPLVRMRYSDDQAKTWSQWREGSLGEIGAYAWRVRWTRLGRMRAPMRVFQFSVTDPVAYRLSEIKVNGDD